MSQDLTNDPEELLKEYSKLKAELETFSYGEIAERTNLILQRHPRVLKGAAEISKTILGREFPFWWFIFAGKSQDIIRLNSDEKKAIQAFDRLYHDLSDVDKFAVDELGKRLCLRPMQINTRLLQIRAHAEVLGINLDDCPQPPDTPAAQPG